MPDQSERAALTDFRITKAANDGWVISVGHDHGMRPDTYAFTTATDMLMALPALIGHEPTFVVTVDGTYEEEQRAFAAMGVKFTRVSD
jgi:hypothetical protein